MKTFSAIYENGVFRPTGPVDLPERSEVELELHFRSTSETVPERSSRPIEAIIAEIMADVPPEIMDELPNDLSQNIDHYLYGTPRK